MYKIFDYLYSFSKNNDDIEIIKINKAEDINIIDKLLCKSGDGYLTRVEQAIRTYTIDIKNYIIVFEVIKGDDECNFVIKDMILFYINKSGAKVIEYKNIKNSYYYLYDEVTNFSDIGFENWIKGGIFNKYGFVSKYNACYDITKSSDYSRLYQEFNDLLSNW